MEVRSAKHCGVQKRGCPDAVTIGPGATVVDAVELMQKYGIHHLLVKDGEVFLGLIEERDLLTSTLVYSDCVGVTKVSAVMRRELPMVGPSTEVGDALEMMLENHLSALPIEENGRVVSILTEYDLLGLFRKMLAGADRTAFVIRDGQSFLLHPLSQKILETIAQMGI
jgi:acetoin utilization protein AcuB